jgi:hypothetical protein
MRFLCLYKPGKPERPPAQQEMAAGARVRLSDSGKP